MTSITDGVDGDYARYLPEAVRTKAERSFGEYLDTVTDRIVDVIIIYGMGMYLMNVFPESSWIFPLVFITMSLSLLRSYIRHQISKIYSRHKEMKYYIFSKIDFVGRDVRLLILALGGVLEGLSFSIPSIKGIPLTLAMVTVSFLHFAQFGNSFFELKRNLNNLEKEERY